MKALFGFVSHVMGKLQNQVGLRGHFSFLKPGEKVARPHVPYATGNRIAHNERHDTIFLAHHDSPRKAHALLVPADVPPVRQKAERQRNLNEAIGRGRHKSEGGEFSKTRARPSGRVRAPSELQVFRSLRTRYEMPPRARASSRLDGAPEVPRP
jgi:hypothetical protein